MPELRGLYGLPPGADFPAALVKGLIDAHAGTPPEALASVELIVNTQRMRRRILDLFADGTPRLLPRVRLVTDLALDLGAAPRAPISPLRRQLELTRLIEAFLDREPTMAPRANAFALAETLAALLAEMEDEGVEPGALAGLDVGEMSAHWARSRAFLSIVEGYVAESGGNGSDAGALRAAVQRRIARWENAPPEHPVIVAGSTGSRGTTQALMQAVARLPRGAVVLPGFDFRQPDAVWARLIEDAGQEDHPQYRFAALLSALGKSPGDVRPWQPGEAAEARNSVVSLALRPAPVTDQWLAEGPRLPDLPGALSGLSLIEAPDPRGEALAIALCLRDGVARGKRAALITPDRNLARRVTAELDRWRLLPDDSAGRPLALSAPGRLLRQVARLAGAPADPAALIAVLKHPLTHSGGERGEHLRRTRMFELHLRRRAQPAVGAALLAEWAGNQADAAQAWARWLTEMLAPLADPAPMPLADHVVRHRRVAERLAQGPAGDGSGALWLEAAGLAALAKMDELGLEAQAGGEMTPRAYAALIDRHLSGEVREAVAADPRVMIWGTLEARVQGADLVVLGGLNDGIWPALPGPDPWLNRQMRREAKLLSPERRVGLSAHDFQQAIAAPEVVLSRALRDDETETVMSRWLNRLYNLVRGLPMRQGPEAWQAMLGRGARWTALARRLEADLPLAPAEKRPAPRPPAEVRPTRLSVTEIQTLIRDPFAIYARRILRLSRLEPLRPRPDVRLRGTVLHKVYEAAVRQGLAGLEDATRAAFLAQAEAVLAQRVAWPEQRILWLAQIERNAEWFLAGEAERRARGTPVVLEARAELALGLPEFTLRGTIDRIDRLQDGRLVIYDYKTGKPPTATQMELFDRQLMLEAVMAEQGRIEGLEPGEVAEIAHIGLGSKPEVSPHPLRDPDAKIVMDPAVELDRFRRLIAAYAGRGQGYASRRAMEKLGYDGDYDHLARYGEWDAGQVPCSREVG
jgi:double-strand break repair protein AddB